MNNKTILYVDDEPMNLRLLKVQLKKKFDVLTAESGTEALNILNEHTEISLVISDMKMPEMNGIEFVQLAQNTHPKIEYYILTGGTISEIIEKAIQSQLIIGYFSKPFEIEKIISTIEKNTNLLH